MNTKTNYNRIDEILNSNPLLNQGQTLVLEPSKTKGAEASEQEENNKASNQETPERLVTNWALPENWEDPIPLEFTEVPEIDASCLPGWLENYVSSLSESTQTPPAMAVMLSLAVIAACVQKRFVVELSNGQYREPLSLWVVVSLPPASRKTAVLNALLAPISQWELEQAKKLAPVAEEVHTKIKITEKRIENLIHKAATASEKLPENIGELEAEISKGTENKPVKSRSMLEEEIKKLRESLPLPVCIPQIFVSDSTPEGLRDLLVDQGERIAVISDEGGIFEIQAGLYNDGKAANIDIFLKGHSGGKHRVTRAKKVTYLNDIAVTFGLAIQPSIVSDLSTGNKKIFRGKGLLARYLWVVPKSNIGTRDVRLNKPILPEVVVAYYQGIKDLLSIPPIINNKGEEEARALKLSSDALKLWQEFAQWLESQQGEGGRLERIQDWTGKLAGQSLRLAGLIHVAENNDTQNWVISTETIEDVISLCKKLIEHTLVAFDSMNVDPAFADAKFALTWALSNYEIDSKTGAFFMKQNDLHKSARFKSSKLERVLKAIGILNERHLVSDQQLYVPKDSKTKKPARIFYLNPSVVNGELQ